MYFTILLSLKKVHFVSLIIMYRINWTKKKIMYIFELCLGPPKSQNPRYSILIQFFIVLLMYICLRVCPLFRFMVLSRRQRRPALLHTMSCKHESWITTAKYLMDDVPLLLSCNHVDNIDDVVSIVSSSLPSRFTDFTDWVCRKDYDHDTERLSTMEEVLKLVRETSLYKHVSHTLSSQSDDHDRMMDLLTALLLALPPRTWSTAIEDHNVLNEIRALVSLQTLPSLLQDEVIIFCPYTTSGEFYRLSFFFSYADAFST